MRVLLVSFTTNPDLQSYLYNCNRELNAKDITSIALGSNNLVVPGININNTVQVKTPIKPGVSIRGIVQYIQVRKKIIDLINNKNIQIVHFTSKHSWNYLMIKEIRLRFKEIKIVHTVHDPIGHEGEKVQSKVKIYYEKILNMVDIAIVHSKNSLIQAKSNLKYNVPIEEAPLGEFDWNEYEDIKNTKKVLVFGRLNAYKGCDLIPKIAKDLYKLDQQIVITVAGKFSNDISEKVIQDIKNQSNINLIEGFIPEEKIAQLIYEHDMLLITYKSITQSGVIIQSYRHSRPVVAFDIEGMREFVNEKIGYLVEPFNTLEYAYKIKEAFKNGNINNLSKCAWEFGCKNYSVENMSKKFIEIYDDIL